MIILPFLQCHSFQKNSQFFSFQWSRTLSILILSLLLLHYRLHTTHPAWTSETFSYCNPFESLNIGFTNQCNSFQNMRIRTNRFIFNDTVDTKFISFLWYCIVSVDKGKVCNAQQHVTKSISNYFLNFILTSHQIVYQLTNSNALCSLLLIYEWFHIQIDKMHTHHKLLSMNLALDSFDQVHTELKFVDIICYSWILLFQIDFQIDFV